ncbi:MAG: molecular chaperone TorD family protein [Proteobacteria bacterium]|nr:molecular chaperone TorD family protein [Pseudomonadota bacterium]MCL2307288.1 molecular chaperone TorD family protein [Pseudomonadota bacterium]
MLASACSALLECGAVAAHRLDETPDWSQEEFAFNRLFVGPMVPVAAPYASVWLSPEPLLMTAETLKIRALHASLGLETPTDGTPDDFLPFELESYAILCSLKETAEQPEAVAAVDEALSWLVTEHWRRWLPPFLDAALSDNALPPMLRAVLTGFGEWVNQTLADPFPVSHDHKGASHVCEISA